MFGRKLIFPEVPGDPLSDGEAGLFKPLAHPLAVVCVDLLLCHAVFPIPFKVTLYALFFILYTIYRLLEREEPFE